MGSLTLTVPSNQDQRVLDAFCNTFGYNVNSGISQATFTKQRLIDYVTQIVKDYERQQATAVAEAAITNVNLT